MLYLLFAISFLFQEDSAKLLEPEQSKSLKIYEVPLKNIINPDASFTVLKNAFGFEEISKTESFTATTWEIIWGDAELTYIDRNGYPELEKLTLAVSNADQTITIENIDVSRKMIKENKVVITNSKVRADRG
jgi:hypothetical protein